MTIKVKALEWVQHPSGKPLWRAHAPNIGWYGASAIVSHASWQFDGLDETITHDAAGVEDAKAAAQADFERRILSALEPYPSPDMREAVDALEKSREVLRNAIANKRFADAGPLYSHAVAALHMATTALRSLTRAKPKGA